MARSRESTTPQEPSVKSAEPPRFTPEQERLLAAIQCSIAPVTSTSGYRMGVAATSVVMLLLPLTYLALVLLVLHTTYWLLVHNGLLLVRRPTVLTIGAFVVPLVVGTWVTIALVKPLFARPTRYSRPKALSRQAEPFLYAYVEQIARATGAPIPRSIRVNCEANAYAGLGQGFSSLHRNDLVLMVGLPFVAGLSVRQLTTVLAHEFGHFAQHSGLRASFVSRSINAWLVDAAFRRDSWDERIDRFLAGSNGFLSGLRLAAHAAFWITRLFLYGLCWLGHVVSRSLSRQMEYDADRRAVRLTGRIAQRETLRKTNECGLAYNMAFDDLDNFWKEGRLPDDFSALISSNLRRITPEMRKRFEALERQQTTDLFDSHPSDQDRYAHQWREDAFGAAIDLKGELGDRPATILFHNYRRLSRKCSEEFYREIFGEQFSTSKLKPSAQLLESLDQELAARKALARYFQVPVPLMYPLPLEEGAERTPERPAQTAALVKQARERMLAAVPDYRELQTRLGCVESTILQTTAAKALLNCDLKIEPRNFNLLDARPKTAETKLRRAETARSQLASRMLTFEAEAAQRLGGALSLLQLDQIVRRIPGGEDLRDEIRRRIPQARLVSRLMSQVRAMRTADFPLFVLLSAVEPNEQRPALINAVVAAMEQLHAELSGLAAELGDHDYPFDHADPAMTLQKYVIAEVPDPNNPWALRFVFEDSATRLMTIQLRLFAQLASAAEKVETTFGLTPLPEPNWEAEEPDTDIDEATPENSAIEARPETSTASGSRTGPAKHARTQTAHAPADRPSQDGAATPSEA